MLQISGIYNQYNRTLLTCKHTSNVNNTKFEKNVTNIMDMQMYIFFSDAGMLFNLSYSYGNYKPNLKPVCMESFRPICSNIRKWISKIDVWTINRATACVFRTDRLHISMVFFNSLRPSCFGGVIFFLPKIIYFQFSSIYLIVSRTTYPSN